MKTHRNMTNQDVALLLKAVSAALEVKEENRFRITAYDRAATAVEHATSEVKDLWDDDKLTSLSGVGSNIAQHLDELFRTGKVKHFEAIFKGLSPVMFELLNVPGIGAKTAYRFCRELGLKKANRGINDLAKAAQAGRIALLQGFGEKSQTEILEALKEFKKGQAKKKRITLPYADVIANQLITYLKKSSATLRADPLGSLRRMVATVGDVDIAVATRKPKEIITWFVKYPKQKKVIEKGPSGVSILLKSGHQVDLRVQKPEAYGAMLQYFTGSKHHNIHLRELALKKGFSLSEHGIKMRARSGKRKMREFTTEEKFYQVLSLPWIPPELREDAGEIEAAQVGKLPKLIETRAIKGDLHIHSDFPIEPSHDEGESSMKTMVKKAAELGYEYLAFSEHNPSLSGHTSQEIIDLLKRKKEAVEQLNYSHSKSIHKSGKGMVHLLNGLEIDIRPNGSLAIPEKALGLLDFAIASVHASFKMPRKSMTERILKGLGHPRVKILGHPTGRKLGQREGYELDWEKVFAFCKKHKKYLEINAWPDRLDLPDTLVREAVKSGVKMVINTDSHAVAQMELMCYGVAVARRGWAERQDIINTLGYNRVKQILKGGE